MLVNAAYQRELDFMLRALSKLRLQARVFHEDTPPSDVDAGLRNLLGLEAEAIPALVRRKWGQDRTLYKYMDSFLCSYVYFRLPASRTALIIGPYLARDPSREILLEHMEQLGFPLSILPQLEDYYASLPVINDPSALMALVYAFCETLWGDAFDTVDVNAEQRAAFPQRVSVDAPIEQIDVLRQMKLLEERYAQEDLLLKIVARGQSEQIEVVMSGVSQLVLQQRAADPLRNFKNYSIICNTLLRKAAQQGGVHPFHLDNLSSQYARAIENAPTLDACSALMPEMIRAYCRLVRTQASQHYSAIVQKTLTYIGANLSGDLSLSALAGLMGVSDGYLSALFHRETGQALGAYITAQRMKAALQLLGTTHLQVQTIAELCGFSDPNYFGKLFRKHYGMTPLKYRQEQAGRHRQEG